MTKMRLRHTAIAALLALGGVQAYADEPSLPKVELLGQEYYRYEVKKGDSVYGIAKQFGWDPQELARLNPGVTQHLTKGAALYYPTGKTVEAPAAPVQATGSSATTTDAPVRPIRHLVKKGETAYGISKQYNISLDELYASHPAAKYGVKAGETIIIQHPTSGAVQDFDYYTVKPGDTLFALARTYGTTVENIMAANPGVSERNFKIGDTIRVPKDSPRPMASAAREVPVQTPSQQAVTPKKPEDASVPGPTPEAVVIEEGAAVLESPTVVEEQQVRVMLVLDDATSKRDSEFVKGFLLALDDYKDKPYKVAVAIEKGNDSMTALKKLNEFEPTVVISTCDRNFPGWLADYGRKTGTEIVNVFDVKSEAYVDNPDMMQVLTPSQYFNEEIAREAARRFAGRTLIMLGTPDTQDAMASALREAMGGVQLELSNVDMTHYPLVDTEQYLVYVYPTASAEVEKSLNAVSQARSVAPLAEVSVMGRPNWVTLTESLGEKMGASDVYFPSRFYFDSTSPEGKAFTEAFTEQYSHAPVKSYPMYAAMGYDIANYFIPAAATTGGDFTLTVPNTSSIQAEVRMKRPNEGSGAYNPVCYLVRMTPYGTVEKITVK